MVNSYNVYEFWCVFIERGREIKARCEGGNDKIIIKTKGANIWSVMEHEMFGPPYHARPHISQ